jgi:hypothetical protein
VADVPALTPVQSSNILAAGHAGTDLYIRFHNGQLWRYRDVPKSIYDEMLGSGSIGRYFAQFVRPNHQGEKIKT